MPIVLMKPTDSIFDSGADAYVNPVNTMGVMGDGLAAEFKRKFHRNFDAYKAACKWDVLKAGGVFIAFDRDVLGYRVVIFNLATKDDWRDLSRLEWVKAGLARVAEEFRQIFANGSYDMPDPTLAVPALGCGLGGLQWEDVRPLIEEAFAALPDITVMLYPPQEVGN